MFPRLFMIPFSWGSSQAYMRISTNLTRAFSGGIHQARPFFWPIGCVATTFWQFRGSWSLVADPPVLCSYKTARPISQHLFLPSQLADWSRGPPRPADTLGGPARWFLPPGGVFLRTQHGQVLVCCLSMESAVIVVLKRRASATSKWVGVATAVLLYVV